MPLQRWTLYDPETEETLTFPYNPVEGGYPKRAKKIASTTSTQGAHVIFEGREELPTVQFNGVILDDEHRLFLEAWFDLPYKVMVTDHLDRQFWAYLTELDITPRNRTNNPESATFTASYIHFGWVT